ncbi:MAG: hypothetical protein GYB64_17530 [Chloroflexi bacterium]|nr:hypothetical protein [Chloroflexota bacterium]
MPGTGIWQGECNRPEAIIGPHPFFQHSYDCMAGGPPGIVRANNRIYVFFGLGQNPAHLGCRYTYNESTFYDCATTTLIDGAREYGPLDAGGGAANPYFDFRFVTSADVVQVGGLFYMAYEGIRGPSNNGIGRDNQFALGFARAANPDSRWEMYPGNPVLGDVADNWGVGHADIVIVDGVTYMYTATPELIRGRYRLDWR